MKLFDIFRLKKPPKTEIERRKLLHLKGRITDGRIIDSGTTEAGEEIVSYYYNIQGVDFESSEVLTEEQRANSLRYAPGAKVGVRFDPRNHVNSTLV